MENRKQWGKQWLDTGRKTVAGHWKENSGWQNLQGNTGRKTENSGENSGSSSNSGC